MDLLDLYASLVLDSTAYERGIVQAESEGKKAAAAIGKTFTGAASTAGKGLATIAKGTANALRSMTQAVETAGKIAGGVAAAGIGVATVATAKLGTTAFESYGEYEQLAGGIETLFGENSDASKAIRNFADNAYATAQMNANDYMQLVTDFSATLLQSLDPTAAAEKANKAITQMSDNANKMGTNIDNVRDAYRGLAKQNATMLDNLKLGYGGNQGELARLLNDSGVLGDVIADEKNVWNVASYDQIIDAIGVIQERLGMLGTSQEEALHTIQGSISMTKAAWSNLLTGFANPDADIDKLVENLTTSLDAVVENAQPVAERMLVSMGNAITKGAPKFAKRLTGLVKTAAPPLANAAIELLRNTATVAADVVPDVAESVFDAVDKLLEEPHDETTTAIVDLMFRLAGIVGDHAPELITAYFGVMKSIITQSLDRVTEDPDAFIDGAGQILGAIVTGFGGLIAETAPRLGSVLLGLITSLTSEDNLNAAREEGGKLLGGIVEGVTEGVTNGDVVSTLTTAGASILGTLADVLDIDKDNPIEDIGSKIQSAAGTFVDTYGDDIEGATSNLTSTAISLVGQLATFLTDAETLDPMIEAGEKVWGGFTDGLESGVEIFTAVDLPNIIDNLALALMKLAPRLVFGLLDGIGAVAGGFLNGLFDITASDHLAAWEDVKAHPENYSESDQLKADFAIAEIKRKQQQGITGLTGIDDFYGQVRDGFMQGWDSGVIADLEQAIQEKQVERERTREEIEAKQQIEVHVDLDGREVGKAVAYYDGFARDATGKVIQYE